MILLCLLMGVLSFGLSSGDSNYKLKYAAILYRHGDRTPISLYPKDPYANESLWPVKFGQLTNLGTLQHYRLGQWFKSRYEELIPEQYDPKEIYVRSTDVDRTLSSALANLAGMFPAYGKSVWNKQLLWRPIPVHTVPEAEDNVLAMKIKCAAYDLRLDELRSSKEYKDSLVKYKDLMEYLTENTGKVVKDYKNILYIYSNLVIEAENNLTLPNWTDSVFPSKMEKPACHSFTIATATPELARLKSGPLLKEIISHMIRVAENKQKHLKLSVYSAHDDTVANLLNSLNMFVEHCPPITATVLLELLHDNSSLSSGNMLVRISYRNSTEIVEPHVLYVPHCGYACPLERFIKLYENLISVDLEKDCKVPVSFELIDNWLSGVAIFVVLFCFYIHFNCFAERKNNYNHTYVAFDY